MDAATITLERWKNNVKACLDNFLNAYTVNISIKGIEHLEPHIAKRTPEDQAEINRRIKKYEGCFLVIGKTAIPIFPAASCQHYEAVLDVEEEDCGRVMLGNPLIIPNLHYVPSVPERDGAVGGFRRDGLLGKLY
jgi:hypothetical protein